MRREGWKRADTDRGQTELGVGGWVGWGLGIGGSSPRLEDTVVFAKQELCLAVI